MRTPTKEELEHAVRTCHWRKDLHGLDICTGSCGPCTLIIEHGQCDTLQKLFNDLAKAESDDCDSEDSNT